MKGHHIDPKTIVARVNLSRLLLALPFAAVNFRDRPMLCGVLIEPQGEYGTKLVATDGKVLAVVDDLGFAKQPLFIPRMVLDQLWAASSLDSDDVGYDITAMAFDDYLMISESGLLSVGPITYQLPSMDAAAFPDWRAPIGDALDARGIDAPDGLWISEDLLTRVAAANRRMSSRPGFHIAARVITKGVLPALVIRLRSDESLEMSVLVMEMAPPVEDTRNVVPLRQGPAA